MVYKNHCVLVLWRKVASALKGLRVDISDAGLGGRLAKRQALMTRLSEALTPLAAHIPS